MSIAVTSGDPVVVGAFRGVALETGSAGATVETALDGTWDLSTKAAILAQSAGAGLAIAQGDKVWYSSAHGTKISVSTVAGTLFGVAMEAVAASATDTIEIKLLGLETVT